MSNEFEKLKAETPDTYKQLETIAFEQYCQDEMLAILKRKAEVEAKLRSLNDEYNKLTEDSLREAFHHSGPQTYSKCAQYIAKLLDDTEDTYYLGKKK